MTCSPGPTQSWSDVKDESPGGAAVGRLAHTPLRCGSVDALIEAIELWTEHWNDDPKPFVWHKPAKEIIDKVRQGRATLHQIKSATDH